MDKGKKACMNRASRTGHAILAPPTRPTFHSRTNKRKKSQSKDIQHKHGLLTLDPHQVVGTPTAAKLTPWRALRGAGAPTACFLTRAGPAWACCCTAAGGRASSPPAQWQPQEGPLYTGRRLWAGGLLRYRPIPRRSVEILAAGLPSCCWFPGLSLAAVHRAQATSKSGLHMNPPAARHQRRGKAQPAHPAERCCCCGWVSAGRAIAPAPALRAGGGRPAAAAAATASRPGATPQYPRPRRPSGCLERTSCTATPAAESAEVHQCLSIARLFSMAGGGCLYPDTAARPWRMWASRAVGWGGGVGGGGAKKPAAPLP